MRRIKVMRIILMYDLDFTSEESKKQYTRFHKNLIKNGYIMLQFSVYMRIITSESIAKNEINLLKKNLPKNGNIRIFKITNLQYSKMILLRGNKRINETINTESRHIKIDYDQQD